MKVLRRADVNDEKEESRIMTERFITKTMNSAYIVKLHFSFEDQNKLYFVMDFMNNGDLFYHILKKYKLKEKRAVNIAAQILLGLKHLHENGVIYRDLKPQNVLLDRKDNVKLVDFGLSKMDVVTEDSRKMTV